MVIDEIIIFDYNYFKVTESNHISSITIISKKSQLFLI